MILIDDIESVRPFLSKTAVQILGPTMNDVRSHVKSAAIRNGWEIVDHSAFVEFVQQRLLADSHVSCCVLDKLIQLDQMSVAAYKVDIHRSWLSPGDDVCTPELEVSVGRVQGSRNSPQTLVDDAIYTGRTIVALNKTLSNHGGIKNAIVAVARESAVEKLKNVGINVESLRVLSDTHDILHLRDFIPWVPFSGRRVAHRTPLEVGQQALPIHIAPLWFEGGAWLHLQHLQSLSVTIQKSVRMFMAEFDQRLGRKTQIRDLLLLGPHVPIPVADPNETVTAETYLETLLPS